MANEIKISSRLASKERADLAIEKCEGLWAMETSTFRKDNLAQICTFLKCARMKLPREATLARDYEKKAAARAERIAKAKE